jgi:hypothetical protein
MLTAPLNTNKEANNDVTIHLQAFQHCFPENLRLELVCITFHTFEVYCPAINAIFMRSAFLRASNSVHGSVVLCMLLENSNIIITE